MSRKENIPAADPVVEDITADPTDEKRSWAGRMFGWVNGPSRAMAFAGLLVVLVLFGRDLLSAWRLEGEIRKLEQHKIRLEESIAADSTLLRRLEDPEFVERFAREHYLMRGEGETVYIIEE